jgi:hypothetical protein
LTERQPFKLIMSWVTPVLWKLGRKHLFCQDSYNVLGAKDIF